MARADGYVSLPGTYGAICVCWVWVLENDTDHLLIVFCVPSLCRVLLYAKIQVCKLLSSKMR